MKFVLFFFFFLTIINTVKNNFISFLECIFKNEQAIAFLENMVNVLTENHGIISLTTFLLSSVNNIRNIINICLEKQTCKVRFINNYKN